MANEPDWVKDLLGSSATTYRPPEQRTSGGDDDVAGYIRSAAAKRGIDPETAIKVAQSEGGLVPNRTGSFKTGKSFWPFQLHYGGPGYEQFGTTAGMGNSFTAQTGLQPGDPNAWRQATDYALDAAAKNGWGAWYGARNVGVTGRQGIGTAPSAPAAAAPAATDGAPDWVRDLMGSSVAGRNGQPLISTNNSNTEAPDWVRDLQASSPSLSGASRSTPSYAGAAQTDEIWPVAGQRWGQVNNPFGGTQARSAGATVALPSQNVGADLTARYGAQVVAPVSGTVVEAFDAPNETDRNANHGWGGMTLLRGDNGYFYRMSHAKPGSVAAQPGQRVAQGQPLQQVGVSGNTTGAHLDYEKFDRPGHFVDPVQGRGGTVASPNEGRGSAVTDRSPTMPDWVRDLMGAR